MRPIRQIELTKLFYIAVYLILIFGFHLILVSIIAFFHFQLGHRLATIENWLFEQGWSIIVLSKVLAYLSIERFLSLRKRGERVILKTLQQAWRPLKGELFTLIIVLAFYFVWLGSPVKTDHVTVGPTELLFSFMGTFLFYMIDFFFLLALNHVLNLEEEQTTLSTIIGVSTIFYFSQKAIFLYSTNFGVHIWLFYALGLCVYQNRFPSWNWPFFIYWLVLAPLTTFCGFDPIWGEFYSPFRMEKSLGLGEAISLLLACFAYISWKDRKVLPLLSS